MDRQGAQLRNLRRQYFSLYPLHQLVLPPSAILANNQTFLKERIITDSVLGRYQPDAGYQKSFWRRVVSKLETGVTELQDDDSDIEVDETFYELMADLMVSQPVAGPSTPGSSYRTFIYDSPEWSTSGGGERSITLVEELAAIQAGTTGLRTWTAALHLAEQILTDPGLLGPRSSSGQLPKIIELGAGTGFLSILLSQLGADVIATDLGSEDDDEATDSIRRTPLARLRENINFNNLAIAPQVVKLDWVEAQTDAREDVWLQLGNECRTIVGADIIYDPDLIPPLVAALQTLLRPTPLSTAIIAATVRNQSTLDLFVKTCEENRMQVDVLDSQTTGGEGLQFWDSALEGTTSIILYRVCRRVMQGAI